MHGQCRQSRRGVPFFCAMQNLLQASEPVELTCITQTAPGMA